LYSFVLIYKFKYVIGYEAMVYYYVNITIHIKKGQGCFDF
jgi:hypothetical protein